jgi:hypothetical protein
MAGLLAGLQRQVPGLALPSPGQDLHRCRCRRRQLVFARRPQEILWRKGRAGHSGSPPRRRFTGWGVVRARSRAPRGAGGGPIDRSGSRRRFGPPTGGNLDDLFLFLFSFSRLPGPVSARVARSGCARAGC